ncbi:MAG: glycosyltransferase [Candidatus Aenigmatarchaeota archaeon]
MVFYMTGVLFKIPKIKKDLFELILISDPIIGAIPGFIAKILKIKILCYEGNVTPWYMPMSYRFNFCKKLLEIFKLLCSKITIEISNAVIVNDGLIKKAMVKQGIKKNKIFVIRSLVDTQKFKPLSLNKNHNNNNFIVGFIGRLEEEKGASLLLELCKKTLTILPEVNFIILGEGSLEKYFRPLQNVKYVGWVDHNAIPQKLDMVNVIISFQKSFGVGELEALSCGKPIIVCKSNEMSEIIKKSEIGLICEPNIESYMESIKILIKNEQLLKRLSKASRDYILKNYSLEYIVNKWNFIIKSIL